MNRICGGCTLCCRLLPVPEIGKAANQRCEHQRATGCKIYRTDRFPHSCHLWSCRWLVDPDTAKLRRPDRSGYVIDFALEPIWINDNDTGERVEEPAVTIWCDPNRRDAWKDPALLELIDSKSRLMLVRYNASEGFVVIPPSRNHTGEWVAMPSVLHPDLVV